MKLLCTFLILTALAMSTAFAKDSPIVQISDLGSVVGSIEATSWTKQMFFSYRAIPYAESPSGELRFKPPKKRAPWTTTLNARHNGKPCPELQTLSRLNDSQLQEDLEDCLSINIFTKNLSAKFPVMFYLGDDGAAAYKPNFLMEKDIVLVVAQVRLGALGFLTTLTNEMPGNVPIMDLQLALDWVQKHINAFGGDPTKVTVFGQGVGAAMLTAAILSPTTSATYFNRAILQSGSILAPWAVERSPIDQAKVICAALGCAQCISSSEIYEFLKKVHPYELAKVTPQEFGPVVGDVYGVLPDEPKMLFTNLNRTIPLMTGFTKQDGSFLMAETYTALVKQYGSIFNVTVREFVKTLTAASKDPTGLARNLFMNELIKDEIFDTNNHDAAWLAYYDIAADISFKSPVIAYANAMQRRGSPVYMYTFDYEGEHTNFNGQSNGIEYPFEGGVHHSNDNIYLFGKFPLNSNDTEFAKKMVNLWYSFAAEGAPKDMTNSASIIEPMKSESGPYFHLNKNITFGSDILMELTATIDDPDSNKLIKIVTSGVNGLFDAICTKYYILTILSLSILIQTYE